MTDPRSDKVQINGRWIAPLSTLIVSILAVTGSWASMNVRVKANENLVTELQSQSKKDHDSITRIEEQIIGINRQLMDQNQMLRQILLVITKGSRADDPMGGYGNEMVR